MSKTKAYKDEYNAGSNAKETGTFTKQTNLSYLEQG